MNLFYAPDITDESYTLKAEESRHIIKVLRKSKADLVHLTDGRGFLYIGEISSPNPKACQITIVTKEKGSDHRNFTLQIAIAPTKNINRLEWFLEKSTEIGIDKVTPLYCQHSERKMVKTDRLKRVLISALKQSLKSVIPILDEPVNFADFIKSGFDGQKFIAHLGSTATPELFKLYTPGKNALILIGPEGDFSPDEIKIAKQNDFVEVKLGNSRLRTETAGVVACHTVNLANI